MRLRAGAGLLLFIATFFAMPLYAAASLCAMPCCQEPSDCCTIGADVPSAEWRGVAPPAAAIAAPAVMPSIAPRRVAHAVRELPPPVSAPLHLLNAVFRI